jgi:hypothetical protein
MEMENLYSVGEVFSTSMFRVPDYQRGYAWEKQHCRDFIEDLELLHEGQDHFFGLLVLHEQPDRTAPVMDQEYQTYQVYDIVDGQQRLTTVVLLLDAIRREMERFESLRIAASGLQERFILVYDPNGQPRPKLTLNRDTRGFFSAAVLDQDKDVEGPTIRSHELLAEARDYFRTYLHHKRRELGSDYVEWLKAQYLKVRRRLTVVVYTVESEADAGVVFETMNNRGKDLTELEKVKNYLLYITSKLNLPAEHNLEDKINDTWTHIFEHLMAAGLGNVENEDQLLRAHWLMAYDYVTRNWKGSRSIKARFDLRDYQGRHEELLNDLSAYLTSLRNATVAYCDVFNPKHPRAFGKLKSSKSIRAQVRSAGERLARLGSLATFLPLLMAVRLTAPEDGEVYSETVDLCELFAFRVYRWLRRRSNTGQSVIFRLGHNLFQGATLERTLRDLRNATLRYSSNEQFRARFEQDEDWFHWRGLKYFLYEYEHYLAEDAGKPVRMPWEVLARKKDTIEHILPQTIVPGGYWAERFTPAEHQVYVHDIGNLTLTYDNSALGNKAFPDKKGRAGQSGCYAGSKLFMEQELAQYEDWTKTKIEERRQRIEEWATERWHVESAQSAAATLTGSEDLVKLMQSVIARTFIPLGQVLLYKALYEAGEEGVRRGELHEKMDLARDQISGVLGGLGRRVNYTSAVGAEKPGSELLIRWGRVGGKMRYFLRPEAREAIEALPELHDVIVNWSLHEINRMYREKWWDDRASQRRDLDLFGIR